jgi:hypothetical protein
MGVAISDCMTELAPTSSDERSMMIGEQVSVSSTDSSPSREEDNCSVLPANWISTCVINDVETRAFEEELRVLERSEGSLKTRVQLLERELASSALQLAIETTHSSNLGK